jgi:hypothetical protein
MRKTTARRDNNGSSEDEEQVSLTSLGTASPLGRPFVRVRMASSNPRFRTWTPNQQQRAFPEPLVHPVVSIEQGEITDSPPDTRLIACKAEIAIATITVSRSTCSTCAREDRSASIDPKPQV